MKMVACIKWIVLTTLFFLKISAMPGISDGYAVPSIDQQVENDLATLSDQKSMNEKLNLLNYILSYVVDQPVAAQTQIDFLNAVKRFDSDLRSTRRANPLSRQEVASIDKFFKRFETSTLSYSGAASYIDSAIKYWEVVVKNQGMKPFQRSLMRQRNVVRRNRR